MIASAEKIKGWRENPVKFVHDELHTEPDAWQRKGFNALADPAQQRIGFKACAGPGKTWLLAAAMWWFMTCFGGAGKHPKGAAVSITGDNLKDNLWAELSKLRQQSTWLTAAFDWTSERICAKQHPTTWFMAARSWSKKANAEEQGRTLSGLHAPFVLNVLDESGGIPPAVGRAAEQALSNCIWGKIIQAGNPISLESMLYEAATRLSHLWTMITITGDPDDPNRSPRIDIDWAREQIKAYGRENPWVMAYILGQFPPSSINVLLGPDEVQAAMTRTILPKDFEYAQKRLGVDVAREGDDRTVLFPRQGLFSGQPVEMRNENGPAVAARIALALERWQWETCFVDDTGGWGGSVIDSLNTGGLQNIPVNFSGKADDPRYLNRRAEMWFRMAAWVKRGGVLPNIPGLTRELTTPTYTFINGKFALEEKKLFKKRLGFSPDLADALGLTFAWAEMPKNSSMLSASLPKGELEGLGIDPEEIGLGRRAGKIESEWDPFRELSGVS